MKDIKPLPLKGKPLEHYGLIETEWYAERVAPDPRPLTDETLEELGLWWNKDSYELDTELGTFYTTPKDKDCTKDANCKCDNEQYLYHFKNKKVVWKTVGSVRMLIEALKGDDHIVEVNKKVGDE